MSPEEEDSHLTDLEKQCMLGDAAARVREGLPPLEPQQRRKRKQLGTTSGTARWRIRYKFEMNIGRQHCRMCGRFAMQLALQPKTGLKFAHIRAWALGGSDGRENMTIACHPCDVEMGALDWTGYVNSIEQEEAGEPDLPFPFAQKSN